MRIRDPIHGTIVVSLEEAAVVDSRFFQRLRHIKQLGFGDLAFPGATHTRHAHSLGAMHVAARVFDAVATQASLSQRAQVRFRSAVRLAVLCHDLGHLPLSHSSEAIAPLRDRLKLPAWMGTRDGQANHEDFTARILLDSSLTPILARACEPLDLSPGQLASLVTGQLGPAEAPFVDGGIDWTPVLRAIVSGELDADRMDYLMRDSFYTGVNYGRFDSEWLLQNLSVAQREGNAVLALSKAAVFAFEDFLLSRYHMFLSVYFHHTSVSFDSMLQRYYQEAPEEFEIPADPETFLECDDVALYAALRRSKNSWAQRIARRQGFRRVAQFTELDRDYDIDALAKALGEAGLDYFTVESRGVLSKYSEEAENSSLYVIDHATGRLTQVARYTPLYQRFAGAVRLTRVYVRPDQLERAQPLVARLTQGEGAGGKGAGRTGR